MKIPDAGRGFSAPVSKGKRQKPSPTDKKYVIR
jgi:hypothetical protein